MGEVSSYGRRTLYSPRPLDKLVKLRNPDDKPDVATDDYGQDIEEPTWGVDVHANKRDQAPVTQYEEGVTVYVAQVVWTIRYRENVAPNVEIVYKGDVYFSEGPPVERGGVNGGSASRYLEIHTKLRR